MFLGLFKNPNFSFTVVFLFYSFMGHAVFFNFYLIYALNSGASTYTSYIDPQPPRQQIIF